MIIGNAMNEAQQQDQRMLSEGLRLANAKDRILYKPLTEGEVIRMGDVLEGIENERMLAQTAIMMENLKQYFDNMDEATKLVSIGDFQKYAFPMVRALFPNLVAHELASVQPMQGPLSLVFYMKFVYGSTKGSATSGADIIANPNETYSSEEIDVEELGTGNGATANYTGNLSYTPVQAGTIVITSLVGAAAVTVTDDGNGNLIGDIAAGNNSINYTTGAYDVTFSGNIDNGAAINVTYSYDAETNDTVPDLDMVLTSTPVRAVANRLRTRWSVEVQQDLKNLHGEDAGAEQIAAINAELKFEIDKTVTRDMRNIASNTVTAWSQTPATGISFTEHKLLFVDKLLEASNEIFKASQRAVGTWILGGLNVTSIIESLPGFVGLPKPANTRGVYKSGSLNGQWDIWKDPTYPGATKNSIDHDGYLMGYKGMSMWEVGYIFAPYIMAYMTPDIQLDDLQHRKAIMSRYGKKAVDGKFFCRGTVTGTKF